MIHQRLRSNNVLAVPRPRLVRYLYSPGGPGRGRTMRPLLALDARRSRGRAWWDQLPREYQGFPRRYPSLGDAAAFERRLHNEL